MNRHTRVIAAVTAAVSTLALAGCSSSAGGAGGDANGQYVVGYSNGITGATAAFGAPAAKLVQAVFDSVNATGGIDGHRIKFVSLDQGNPGSGQAATNVTQLITQDHANAILGMSISDDCSAVASIVTKYRTPLLCERVPEADLSPVKKYVFADTSAEAAEVQPQISFMKKTLDKPNPNVAIITSDTIGARAWATALGKAVQAAGGHVTTTQTMPLTATSASAQIAKIVSGQPDMLFGEVYQQFWGPIMSGLKAAGLDIPVVTTDGDIFYHDIMGFKNPKIYETRFAAPFSSTAPSPEQKPLMKQLSSIGIASDEALNVGEGSQEAAGAYVLVAALQKCGYPCSVEKLATALEGASTTAAGLIPSGYGYSPTSHFAIKNYTFYHWDPAKNALATAGTYPAGNPIGS